MEQHVPEDERQDSIHVVSPSSSILSSGYACTKDWLCDEEGLGLTPRGVRACILDDPSRLCWHTMMTIEA